VLSVPNITVVDDDKQIGALVEEILEREGYDVVCYRDARTPDLVILDIRHAEIEWP